MCVCMLPWLRYGAPPCYRPLSLPSPSSWPELSTWSEIGPSCTMSQYVTHVIHNLAPLSCHTLPYSDSQHVIEGHISVGAGDKHSQINNNLVRNEQHHYYILPLSLTSLTPPSSTPYHLLTSTPSHTPLHTSLSPLPTVFTPHPLSPHHNPSSLTSCCKTASMGS